MATDQQQRQRQQPPSRLVDDPDDDDDSDLYHKLAQQANLTAAGASSRSSQGVGSNDDVYHKLTQVSPRAVPTVVITPSTSTSPTSSSSSTSTSLSSSSSTSAASMEQCAPGEGLAPYHDPSHDSFSLTRSGESPVVYDFSDGEISIGSWRYRSISSIDRMPTTPTHVMQQVATGTSDFKAFESRCSQALSEHRRKRFARCARSSPRSPRASAQPSSRSCS